jgi:catechol 2,3-dioxygenase-like lactoylglutathione lyase family enzyme
VLCCAARRIADVSDIIPLGLDHVVLRVADVARACRWYGAVLGAKVERVLPGIGLTQLRVGASLIDLVPIPPGEEATANGRNMDHFCVELAAFDEAALRARLEQEGIAPGEVHRRYGARGHGPSMYLTDPDGNIVELKGPPDADQTERAPGAVRP